MSKSASAIGGKPNKVLGIGIGILNVVVFLIAIGLGRSYPVPAIILSLIYFSIVLGIAINKRHIEKSKENGEVKKYTNEIRGYVVWMVIMVAILGFNVWQLGGFNPSSTVDNNPQSLATSAVQQLKSSQTFPYTLDEVTTYTDVTSEGGVITYHYQIKGADTSNVTDSSLRDSIQPKVCANTSTHDLLDRGVSLSYSYTVVETGQQYLFTIQSTDCS